MTQVIGVDALGDLARARRRHFVEKIDLINAIYKAYIVGAALLIGGSLLVGLVQSAPLGSTTQKLLVSRGPYFVGLAFSFAIFLGLRSGSRGGPLALQGADVRMILLSAIGRSRFLRGRALSQVRSAIGPAVLIGGVAGGIAHRALGVGTLKLVVEGALIGLLLVLSLFGAGYIASGLRINKWIATSVGMLIIAWAGMALYKSTDVFPGSWIGSYFFHQRGFTLALAGSVVIVLILLVGLYFVVGLSLEVLDKRARLVGTLRFAATTRDIRTVILLRRQLSGERSRQGRSVLSKFSFGSGATGIISKRSVESLYRWPFERIIRFFVLAVIAGVSARSMWSGSFFPLVIATVALFLAATDLLEPLSQFSDRPEAIASIGIPISKVESRLLLVPFVGMIIFVLVGTLSTAFFSGFTLSLHLGLISAIPLAASSTTGAAVAILRKQASAGSAVLMPEVVAITSVIVEILPFAVVGSGFISLVDAYNLHAFNTALLDTTAISAASFSLLLPLAAWTWIRRRNEFSARKV